MAPSFKVQKPASAGNLEIAELVCLRRRKLRGRFLTTDHEIFGDN